MKTTNASRRSRSGGRAHDRRAFLSGLGMFVVGAAAARAQTGHHHHRAERAATCASAALACATTATPYFAPDGSLWLAFVAGDKVLVAASSDLGRSFTEPVAVTPESQQIDWGPDSRPQIAVDKDGRVFVTYAIFKDNAFNGQVLFTRSVDRGRSFSRPRPITSDPESQRFQVLGLDPAGGLFAAWLDKRRRPAARARGETYPGAALAYTWLPKDGNGIAEAAIAQDNTCECCRIGVAFVGPGKPVLMFRNIFDASIRDHAVLTFSAAAEPGPAMRVSDDDWKTDTCPHHGPSLAVSESAYHVAWFTNGRVRQGLFYSRSLDGGGSFSTPLALGTPGRQAARPTVMAGGDVVHLAWKEFNGESTALLAMTSHDDGRTWSGLREVARTSSDSDHPLFVNSPDQAYISWLTRTEGYRLLPVGSAS